MCFFYKIITQRICFKSYCNQSSDQNDQSSDQNDIIIVSVSLLDKL